MQVCNVGDICGGTAACAWTITRAFPDCEQTVLFLSHISDDTRKAFSPVTVFQDAKLSRSILQEQQPDVLLLHNVSPQRIEEDCLPSSDFLTIQYHHSRGTRASADVSVACSRWLADQFPARLPVLYQAVPQAPRPEFSSQRQLAGELIVGRICSPQLKKWPRELIPFYEQLATAHPQVRWEFVGAPRELQPDLLRACDNQATFHPAGLSARQLLWAWHVLLYHHPTLTESFGRTVAEAMRTKTVPIVDARGGFCEQIAHGKTGFLCDNLEDFSQALIAVSPISNWFEISQAAGVTANQKFSLQRLRTELLQLIHARSAELLQ